MYNILICDDEADIRSALRIYLASDDYNIIEAENGKQALEIIARENIHLLLMDIMMPVMDGLAALSKLREFSPDFIILGCTHYPIISGAILVLTLSTAVVTPNPR